MRVSLRVLTPRLQPTIEKIISKFEGHQKVAFIFFEKTIDIFYTI